MLGVEWGMELDFEKWVTQSDSRLGFEKWVTELDLRWDLEMWVIRWG